jgi:hypothetical protein
MPTVVKEFVVVRKNRGKRQSCGDVLESKRKDEREKKSTTTSGFVVDGLRIDQSVTQNKQADTPPRTRLLPR